MARFALSGALLVGAFDISPNLHPASDNKFFGKDYGKDMRPKPVHSFKHVYPSVQNEGDFDSDFVSDENHATGEWTTQMEYDMTRNRLAREKRELAKAKAVLEKQKADYDFALAEEKAAEKAAEAAREAREAEKQRVEAEHQKDVNKYEEDKARHEKEKRDWERKRREHGDSVKRSEDSVAGAQANVEAEIIELKDCETELQAAEKRLEDLLGQLEVAEREAAATAAAADSQEDAAEEAEKAEAVAEGKTHDAQASYDKTMAKLNAALKELDMYKGKLDEAAFKLKLFRKNYRNSTGGAVTAVAMPSSKERSAAVGLHVGFPALASAMALLVSTAQ